MNEILDLIHELRCDINYCKVSGENDTEIQNANETLIKLQNLVKVSKMENGIPCKCGGKIKPLSKPEDRWTHSCGKCGETLSL